MVSRPTGYVAFVQGLNKDTDVFVPLPEFIQTVQTWIECAGKFCWFQGLLVYVVG